MNIPDMCAQSPPELDGENAAAPAERLRTGDRDTCTQAATPVERLLQFTLAVTEILAESPRLSVAIERVLRIAAETLEWDVGAVWLPDSDGTVLRCSNLWSKPTVRYDEFKAASSARAFSPGTGLPGRVWSSCEPVWIPNIASDDSFPRGPAATEEGLRGGFAFPILLGRNSLE
jgi:hypothetical protein